MLKEQAKWEDGEMACTPMYKYIISIQAKRNKPVGSKVGGWWLVPLGRNGEERNMLKEQAKIEQACSFKRIIKQ